MGSKKGAKRRPPFPGRQTPIFVLKLFKTCPASMKFNQPNKAGSFFLARSFACTVLYYIESGRRNYHSMILHNFTSTFLFD